MAIFASFDHVIKVNGTDYSDWITQVSLPISVADLPTTAFGDTWDTRIGGLKSATCTIDWHQDFVDNGHDEVIFNALGTSITLTIKPTSDAISTGNPEYQCNVLVTSWSPIDSTVGELATLQTTWPVDGPITRDVTP